MTRHPSERDQLTLFRALPAGDMALRDAQDLMAYPFFSLAKSRRIVPIRFEAGLVRITVEGVPEHGIATIWDADVLIWAASQIVQARDDGILPSRWMVATPYEILRFTQRSTGQTDYLMLKAALDRLQSTTVATSIRQPSGKRLHRFSWINEWKEHVRPDGRSDGIELILADWFFTGVMDNALVLTLDPAYFRLSGGIERWLYRLVRKHGGRQAAGWRFELRHLHLKSGSLQRYSDFALHLRKLVSRQPLPGYRLVVEHVDRSEWLRFWPQFRDAAEPELSTASGEDLVGKLCPDSGNRTQAPRVITRSGHGESHARIGREPASGQGFGAS